MVLGCFICWGIHFLNRINWFGIFGLEVEGILGLAFAKLFLKEFSGPHFLGACIHEPKNCFGHVCFFLETIFE